ncbi:MAG: carbamoyl-phosphate synthase large subunit [bacterium]
MPVDKSIKSVLIVGSGPIVIGQACEFDYSGTQACKALKEEGIKVILVNSNPATIMTDPETAHRTYIEPITTEVLEKVIIRERPDCILPTLGGQTGLNVAFSLAKKGILDKYNVRMIGANYDAIKKAENRLQFKKAMERINLELPNSALAYNVKEAVKIAESIGFPVIIRPSFILGGTGSGVAYNVKQLERLAKIGIESSLVGEILVEESVLGWKEYELEVMRDHNDNVVIICSIENFDPMGIHTGDSITVAPAQTLTDKCYQKMRDASINVIREIGVDTGGSNIQFAVNPRNGKMVVIEMNPRVSRSSALASKATGFPIAKIAAKLAIGFTLDEIRNDITKVTPACFEPTIDYCVVKVPRFTFEKFPEADPTLNTSMKSVGETMSIGRNFPEALQKALRGLETGHSGLDNKIASVDNKTLRAKIRVPNCDRIFYIKKAIQRKISVKEIYSLSKIDPWFLDSIKKIVEAEERLKKTELKKISTKEQKQLLYECKQMGFSDHQLGELLNSDEHKIRALRKRLSLKPVYKLVDTCGAEFEAYTPYYYSTYESENEARVSKKKKIMILSGGPNRVGQGIEFDYCCCQACFALSELGYESIMVNSNPETVSTDYDTADKLYFEPLTFEDVMNIVEVEKPDGIIVQFGGQTPLNLARRLHKAGVKIIGTSVDSIDRAEDRKRFSKLLKKIGLIQPASGTAFSLKEALRIGQMIGYPVLVRPSYVLGGRAMRVVYDKDGLVEFFHQAVEVSPDHPVLVDKFIENAIEVDVDAVSDGKRCYIGGIMEHIEEAGIHSGDSACALPPYSIGREVIDKIKHATYALASELKVKGLMNIQFAVKNKNIYVLEVNPRASRTVPFVSKATGVSLARIAAKIMTGKSLAELGIKKEVVVDHIAVKESVLPFSRFSGIDAVLGPEMKSTGEVMGIDNNFGIAFAKSQIAANQELPVKGNVFMSVKDEDKRDIIFIAKKLVYLGFKIFSTFGTARVLQLNNIPVKEVKKVFEKGYNIGNMLKDGEIDLVINTPSGEKPFRDEKTIRSLAVLHGVSCITTIDGAQNVVNGIEAYKTYGFAVKTVQEYHEEINKK